MFASLRIDDAKGEGEGKGDEEERRRVERNTELLEDDLSLTEHALRANPKVYWIWNHRMWCLTQYPPSADGSSEVWERELKLVEKMLDYDPRNFHGWNCRRAIVHHLALSILDPSPSSSSLPPFPALLSNLSITGEGEAKTKLLALAERELAYSLRKIESNFSNFSAWHQRTKLLPHVWAALQLSQEEVDGRVDEEFELVKQAMYTDPSDQSVWFYHRWLIDQVVEGGRERKVKVLEEECKTIEELFELEPDSKWCAISLAHLNTLLADECEGGEREGEARARAKELLERLIELDPDRAARYHDLLDGKAHF